MPIPLFLIPIIVGLAAQSLKPLLNRQWYARLEKGGRKIPRYGGMPSAHTAFAFSLAITVAVTDGVMGPLFVMAAAFVIFVLDDALRMRIFLGRHGEALRQLVARLPKDAQGRVPYLEARLGHTWTEVVAGAVLGTILTWLLLSWI